MGKFKKTALFLKRNSLTILTLTISFMTLFVYVRQTNILSKQTEILTHQNKASFWPRLLVGSDKAMRQNGDSVIFKEFSIVIGNQGVGPAIIERVVVKVDGKEFANWTELLTYSSIDKTDQESITLRFISNRVIQPGEYLKIFDIQNNQKVANIMYEKNILQNLEISICYKSIHDDYWTVTNKNFVSPDYGGIKHIKSESCTLKADVYFAD